MSQQQLQQTGGQGAQAFDQYVPQTVSQAVYQLEQLETDAEWAHGQAMKMGDHKIADKLADVAEIALLQKNLLLRESDLAPTMSQCTQQAFQQCSQGLQQSGTPGVQQIAQQIQQVSQQVSQAAQEAAQPTGSQGMGGQATQVAGKQAQTAQQPTTAGQQSTMPGEQSTTIGQSPQGGQTF